MLPRVQHFRFQGSYEQTLTSGCRGPPPFFFFFKILFIFREGEKHQCVIASHVPPTGDLAHNPGMCPDGNQTDDPLVQRPALNPLSHTSQGLRGF